MMSLRAVKITLVAVQIPKMTVTMAVMNNENYFDGSKIDCGNRENYFGGSVNAFDVSVNDCTAVKMTFTAV